MSSFVNRSSRDRDSDAKKAAAKAAFAGAKKQRAMQTMRVPPWKDMGIRNRERKDARSQGWRTALQNAIRTAERNRLKCESQGGRWTRSECVMPGQQPAPADPSTFLRLSEKERQEAEKCAASGGVWYPADRAKTGGHPAGCAYGPRPDTQSPAQDPDDTTVPDTEENETFPGAEVDPEGTAQNDAVIVDDSGVTTQGPDNMPIREKKGVNPLLLVGAAAGAIFLASR